MNVIYVITFAKNSTQVSNFMHKRKSSSLRLSPKFLSSNNYILGKNVLPNHALNISDIIISKFSYMGIEAMIYDVQVLSVLLDKEKMFKTFVVHLQTNSKLPQSLRWYFPEGLGSNEHSSSKSFPNRLFRLLLES